MFNVPHFWTVYIVPLLSFCLFGFFSLVLFRLVSSSFLLSVHVLLQFSCSIPSHVASRMHCVWTPISGPPVLWARWPCLLWETLWHGEGIKGWPAVDCCHVPHSSLHRKNAPASTQGLHWYTSSPVSVQIISWYLIGHFATNFCLYSSLYFQPTYLKLVTFP